MKNLLITTALVLTTATGVVAGDKHLDAKDFYEGADKSAEWFQATQAVNELKNEIFDRVERIISIAEQVSDGKSYKTPQWFAKELKAIDLVFEELMDIPQQYKEYSWLEEDAAENNSDVQWVAGTSFQVQNMEARIQDAYDAVDSLDLHPNIEKVVEMTTKRIQLFMNMSNRMWESWSDLGIPQSTFDKKREKIYEGVQAIEAANHPKKGQFWALWHYVDSKHDQITRHIYE